LGNLSDSGAIRNEEYKRMISHIVASLSQQIHPSFRRIFSQSTMIPYILALCLNVCLALAASRTSAPSGALVVSKAPAKGQYSKIQDAVNALSTSSTTAQSIFIEAGTYNEQVYIAPRKASLTIFGYSENTDDYNQNVVTITQKLSLNEVATDDLTATLRAWSTNFKLYNVNLANTYGQGKQALALNAAAAVRNILPHIYLQPTNT
jgi:pectinesterase